jgi:hypothetical protein
VSLIDRAVLRLEIKILGFQAADLLQIDENIKHSYFIYPDENASSLLRLLYTELICRHTPAPHGHFPPSFNHVRNSINMPWRYVDSDVILSLNLLCSSPNPRRCRKMGKVRRCLLVSILWSYLIGMILGLHPRLSLVVRILVRSPFQSVGKLLTSRDGTSGVDDGEDCYEIEVKAWLL